MTSCPVRRNVEDCLRHRTGPGWQGNSRRATGPSFANSLRSAGAEVKPQVVRLGRARRAPTGSRAHGAGNCRAAGECKRHRQERSRAFVPPSRLGGDTTVSGASAAAQEQVQIGGGQARQIGGQDECTLRRVLRAPWHAWVTASFNLDARFGQCPGALAPTQLERDWSRADDHDFVKAPPPSGQRAGCVRAGKAPAGRLWREMVADGSLAAVKGLAGMISQGFIGCCGGPTLWRQAGAVALPGQGAKQRSSARATCTSSVVMIVCHEGRHANMIGCRGVLHVEGMKLSSSPS